MNLGLGVVSTGGKIKFDRGGSVSEAGLATRTMRTVVNGTLLSKLRVAGLTSGQQSP